jgi:hypothetical protein
MPRVASEQLDFEAARREPPPQASGGRVREVQPAEGARRVQNARRGSPASRRPAAAELLETSGALLTRSHLRELGLERRAIDAVFRALPVVALPGYSRPMIRADQYLELVDLHTYRDDRVRPSHA